jgi:hypothetical protein
MSVWLAHSLGALTGDASACSSSLAPSSFSDAAYNTSYGDDVTTRLAALPLSAYT